MTTSEIASEAMLILRDLIADESIYAGDEEFCRFCFQDKDSGHFDECYRLRAIRLVEAIGR